MAFIILNIKILLLSFPDDFLFLQQLILHLSLYWFVHPWQVPGMMQFCATDCKSESVLATALVPWESNGCWGSGLRWVFCITCEFYFFTWPVTLFAKLTESWSFSNQVQEIDLCVHAMLGTAWVESKSGGKNGNCLALRSSPAVAPCERITGTVSSQHCFPVESSSESEFIMGTRKHLSKGCLSRRFNFSWCFCPHF